MQCRVSKNMQDLFSVDLGVDISSLQPEIIKCKRRFQADLWNTICDRVLQGQQSWTKTVNTSGQDRAPKEEIVEPIEGETPKDREPLPSDDVQPRDEGKNESNFDIGQFKAESWNNQNGDSDAFGIAIASLNNGRSKALGQFSRTSQANSQRSQLRAWQQPPQQQQQQQEPPPVPIQRRTRPQQPPQPLASLHTAEVPKLLSAVNRYLPLPVSPRVLTTSSPSQQHCTQEKYKDHSRYAAEAVSGYSVEPSQFVFRIHPHPQAGVDPRKRLVMPSCIFKPEMPRRTKPSPSFHKRSCSTTSRQELLVTCNGGRTDSDDVNYAAVDGGISTGEHLDHPSDANYYDDLAFYANNLSCSAGGMNVNHYVYANSAYSDADSESCATTVTFSNQQPGTPATCDSNSDDSSFASGAHKFVPLVVGNWWERPRNRRTRNG